MIKNCEKGRNQMGSLFEWDNPIIIFLSRVFDMAYLNVLCFVCCIPIITIGPSITAMYYCMLKISRDRDSSITRMFFHSFKTNMKQGSLMTLIFLGLIIFFVADIVACSVIEINYLKYIKIILFLMLTLLFMVISYAFPLLAQFENTIINTLKNALMIGIANIISTCVIIVLNAIPIVLFLYVPGVFLLTLPAWIFGGLSVIAMINSKMFVKIFDKYINEKHEL